MPTLGITLAGIKHFLAAHGEQAFASALSDYSHEKGLPPGKTYDVCDVFLKPATVAQQESYCGLAKTDPTRSDYIGQATAFVSHAWGQQFLDVVAALEDYDSRQPTPTVFWFAFSPTTSTRHPTASSAGGRPCLGTILGN